jgi:endonuclease YncB( thermonuclease family)
MNLWKPIRLFLLFSTLITLSIAKVSGAEYNGKVVGVHDGDTLTLLTESKQQTKVRLGEIDTPESRQPYGTRAKQVLSDLVYGKQARVVVQDTDRYRRIVGKVYVDSTDVNAEMVKQGAAWVYRKYARDQALYRLEEEAKAAKRGLWGLPEAQRTPPWEWRQAQQSGGMANSATAVPTVAVPSLAGFTCGIKRYCKQMTSCEEAKLYMTKCRVRSLDGNGDGVPCESRCR